MWFLRKIMKISYANRITNEGVLRRARMERELLSTIRKRQYRFLGHVTHKEKIEYLALRRMMEGKRSRGRQRITFLDTIRGAKEHIWLQTEHGRAVCVCTRTSCLERNDIRRMIHAWTQ